MTKITMMGRWNQHVRNAQLKVGKGCHHFWNAIRLYGKNAFSHEVLEVCDNIEAANLAEVKWIEKLGTTDSKKGFNLMRGGSHSPHPNKNPWDRPEYREKSCVAAKARWGDPERKAKYMAAARNKWADPEYREKTLAAIRKAAVSPDVQAKRSSASKAIWKDQEIRSRIITASKAAKAANG